MKKTIVIALAILLVLTGIIYAQDVREAARRAEEERLAAEKRAHEIEKRIIHDRAALLEEVDRLEARERELEKELEDFRNRIAFGTKKMERLDEKWASQELEFREISGNVRVVARDVETMLRQSVFTALAPERLKVISPLLKKGYFPDIDDISALCGLFFDEIERTGQVGLSRAEFVGRDGNDKVGEVITLGPFTSIYNDNGEIGFLTYSPESGRFFALSSLPPRSVQKKLKNYITGKSSSVPVDITAGAALRQVTHKTSIIEQVQAGGPIVYPIALIAITALVMIIYKLIFLSRVHGSVGRIMGKINSFAARGDWESCDGIVTEYKGKKMPVIQVVQAGLGAREEDRETLESVLQESILRELPRVERGMSLLAIFGAVAPLLGLLGTVTGMIDTFRVITLFGTGDPKLMSGGISEALITTELGLAVAIPIMLMHTFLSRRVNGIIGEMEEKAVYLTNIIQKAKRSGFSLGHSPEVDEILNQVKGE